MVPALHTALEAHSLLQCTHPRSFAPSLHSIGTCKPSLRGRLLHANPGDQGTSVPCSVLEHCDVCRRAWCTVLQRALPLRSIAHGTCSQHTPHYGQCVDVPESGSTPPLLECRPYLVRRGGPKVLCGRRQVRRARQRRRRSRPRRSVSGAAGTPRTRARQRMPPPTTWRSWGARSTT